jgi:2'-5' RNA ligase
MKQTNEEADSPHSSPTDPHPASWRVFCAIEITASVCERIVDHMNKLKQSFPDVPASWNRDGKFHLTLKFIGDISRARVERFSLAADRATNNLSPFDLVVKGAGAFPMRGTPKVLWLGIDDLSGKLAELQTRLEEECAQAGFAKEERPFHPHLTLARLRKPNGARALAAAHQAHGFAAVEVPVRELLVIRSELSSAGSRYSLISRHAFEPFDPKE